MVNIKIEHNLKFKTASLGCFLRLPLSKKNLALANVLTNMQANASQKYPGVGLQAQAMEEFYDMNLEIFPEVFGNQIVVFYALNFIEPREILNPDYNYRSVVQRFFEIIKKPLFSPQLLKIAKTQLQMERNQYYDLPANFATQEFFDIWYRKSPQFTDNVFGDIDVIQACTLEQIKKFFEQLTASPAMCLGQAYDPDLLTDLIQPELTWAGFSSKFSVEHLALPAHFAPIDKEAVKHNEQAQLLLGYGYDFELSDDLKQFGGLYLSQYLAGDESSRLFSIVREKLGAAYAIDATNYLNNSLFLISTGIDHNLINDTKSAIENTIKEVGQDQIDQDLFKKARQALKRMYVTSQDRQDLIMIQMLANAIRNRDLSFDDRIKEVEKFTPQKLQRFAQSLFLNESYCLK